MDKLKRSRFKIDIISASEIGQFYFCSVAWYLKKCGYKPISINLETGTKKHIEYAKIIDNYNSNLRISRIFFIFGIVFLIIAFFIIFIR